MATIISNTNTTNILTMAKSGATSLDALLQEAVQSSGSATSTSGTSGTSSDSGTSNTDSGISISTADTASIQATAKSGK